jgi:hypothetical protein
MNVQPIYDWDLKTHRRIKRHEREAIVQSDWVYNYDIDFFTGVPNPMDWSVDPTWVGKRACDVVCVWEEFWLPIHDFQI